MMVFGKGCPCLCLNPGAFPSYFLPCPVEEGRLREQLGEHPAASQRQTTTPLLSEQYPFILHNHSETT